jgi:hypothetical protein
MAILDLSSTNQYPLIQRVALDTAAQEITLPEACTEIKLICGSALHFANVGSDDDAFGSAITQYGSIPANHELKIPMETGRQDNKKLLVGVQSGTGNLTLIIIKK